MDLWLVDNKGNLLKEWKDVDRDICEFTFVMLEPGVGEDIACVIKRFKDKGKKKESWFDKEMKKKKRFSPNLSAKTL
jgi:hypothetical protein